MRIEFRPAPANSGLVFVRDDMSGARIPAIVANRIESPRRTTLTCRGVSVEMVEHVLAALAGLQIDNCDIGVNAAEMPGCDGSSLDFVQALDSAGSIEQDATRSQIFVRDVMRVGTEDSWIEARPAEDGAFSLRFRLDYGLSSPIGSQTYSAKIDPTVFRKEIAPCRTFLLKEEADWLRSQGLAERTTFQDALVFDDNGPIDNTLRFADECARHKALDMIGDLALTGCDLIGRFTGYRSGHRLNAELVKALLNEGQRCTAQRRSA